jgi:hypothetical protein
MRRIPLLNASAANYRRKQGRDLLEIVLSLLQQGQGPVRDPPSGCTRQGSGVRGRAVVVCMA